MWNKPGQAVPIDPSQVVVGLYLWLDVRWDEHPFLSNRLMVKTPKDVAVIKSLDVTGRLYCYPDKSTTAIPAFVPPEPATDAVAEAAAAAAAAMAAEVKQIETAKN